MKKLISLLLCAALVLSLCACSGTPTQTTKPTEVTVPPTTTEPAPSAADLYNEAAEKIRSAPSMLIDYTIKKEMTLGRDVYYESQKTALSLSGIGSEDFAAKSNTAYTWRSEYYGDARDGSSEDYYADARDVYIDGVLYGTMDTTTFSTEMTQEAYLKNFIPGVLLTAELYEQVEQTSDGTFTFSKATALEPWLAEEGCVLVEASGTASVDAAGALKDCTYDVSYTRGGVLFHLEISSRALTGPITVEAPADLSVYVPTETPEAYLAFERSIGLLLQARDLSTTMSENILIQATGVLKTLQTTVNLYSGGDELMANVSRRAVLNQLSPAQNIYTSTQEETYRDGTYAIAVDGGAPQTDSNISGEDMDYYCMTLTTETLPILDTFETMTATDLGATWLIEFTLDESSAREVRTYLVGAVYEDANLLDNAASAYRTEVCGGYLGIDKLTGLPASVGQEFTGIHTIDGVDYALTLNYSQNLLIGSGDAYLELTGEPLTPEEPEEKATPLLYHVTGENGEEMWLFGTIHVGDGRTAYMPEELLNAFTASDALAVEFDMDAFEEKSENDPATALLISMNYLYTDGTTINDHVTDDALVDEAMKILKSTGNYNSTLLMMKPIILAQSIENDYVRLARGVSSSLGMDKQLLALAQEQGKEILEVESAESQIKMLTGYSDDLQELLLLEAVTGDPLAYQADTMELFEMWCSGDEAALIAYITADADSSDMTEAEKALYDEYWTAMSTDRNAAMLDVAVSYLNGDKVVFYAVGLAHLLAEDGLVNTLREAGYTVELVTYG